jgi:FtsP/CotA-like multicopper oxidase with cupredoxin domain
MRLVCLPLLFHRARRVFSHRRLAISPLVILRILFLLTCAPLVAANTGAAQTTEACPRAAEGSTVQSPPELRSQNGVLEVALHFKYQVTFAGQGPPRYCYVTDDGIESPTLRLRPGDQLIIDFHNDLPNTDVAGGPHTTQPDNDCQAMAMTASVTNLHFHGLTVPPKCHQDEVIRTAIPPGTDFDYRLTIPADEPPGLYWYHPHPHGFSERQVQGGASGALIVEGIERAVPAVDGLPQRVLVLRDQSLTNLRFRDASTPAWDVSLNYVPVLYPVYRPAVISAKPSRKELWRVLNAGADTILNLRLVVKGEPQPLQLIAVDGVPLGRAPAKSQIVTEIALPPGARAEFVITTPAAGEPAELVTTQWDTGIEGDSDPARPIARVVSSADATEPVIPEKRQLLAWKPDRHEGNAGLRIQRRLYFSQFSPNPAEGDTSVFYYVTVTGDRPEQYRMGQAPNIVVHQGDQEDWTVENRAQEDHVFHMHQLHFQVLEVNGKPVNDPASRDTFNLPHWDGSGPYPSAKFRMDFSDPNILGTSLYHCHILKHEDMGMMGVIQVLPPGKPTTTEIVRPAVALEVATEIKIEVSVRAGGPPDSAPTGTVQFFVDGIASGRPVPLERGRAVLTTSFSSDGVHEIAAAYSGDARYDESMARPLKIKLAGP